MNQTSLGALADPYQFRSDLDITNEDISVLLEHLEKMLLIREVERYLANEKRDGKIGGPVHLGVGQEAVAVGVSAMLRPTDRVFGAHRSHSHVLALGADIRCLFAEILGKETGLSKGMGGSMHLWDQKNGFYGSVPIVAGTVSLAVGAALAAKLQETDDIGVAYLGDGAVEEGVVHESLNLARVLKAPILFVVENNLFASHMHISLRQPNDMTARFAVANDIPYEVVDGNDVIAVRNATASLVSKARAGEGPVFLEAVTYRWYGHVDWREDIDVGVNRSADEVNAWRKRDPISRLVNGLISSDFFSTDELKKIQLSIESRVKTAWQKASQDPYPEISSLLDRVYFNREVIA
jgi:pyruvate dehydrogenase E1 component alpha subunit